MKRVLLLFSGISLLALIWCFGEKEPEPVSKNEFKIGIFGANEAKTHWVDSCEVFYEKPVVDGQKTSVYNVIAEDGFNIYQLYDPTEWTSINQLKSRLLLTKANGLKIEVGAGHFYKPEVDREGNPLNQGTNIYNNFAHRISDCQNPASQNYFRPDIDHFIDEVFNVSPYQEIIWGYHLCEEASYFHYMHFIEGGKGNRWGDTASFKNVEIPPANVKQVMNYYKERINDKHKKMILMEANHHKNINAHTKDHEGIFNPQDYIQLMNKNDKRDVYFEGSYTVFNSGDWLNQQYDKMYEGAYHYLGPFQSMEYAKKYGSEVHKIINIEGTSVNALYEGAFHSDSTIKNGNFLWFQAYNAIIHGAKGIWFWDLNFSWQQNEQNEWQNKAKNDRFERRYFPINYQKYVGPLAQELRYLVDNNFLSTDEKSVLMGKTDQVDQNHIVAEASTYIPHHLPAEKRTENYGLRYTIRSNGKETVMILSNPLNISISTQLDLSRLNNQIIKSSNGVEVLFEKAPDQVDSKTYKTDRNSGIDLGKNTISKSYYLAYETGKKLRINLGPLDVKVFRFAKIDY